MGMPVVDVAQVDTYVSTQIAVLNNPAITLKVSSLRYHMREVIMNLPNIPEDQRPELQSELLKVFKWLPEVGRLVMAYEIDTDTSLKYTDRTFLKYIIVEGMKLMNDDQKEYFRAARNDYKSDTLIEERALYHAKWIESQANFKYQEALRVHEEKKRALSDAQRDADAEASRKAFAGAAIGSIIGAGATALACVYCPPLAAAAVSRQLAATAGATVVAGAGGGYAGTFHGYEARQKSIADATTAIEDAKINLESAQRTLTNATKQVPNAIEDVILRLGN